MAETIYVLVVDDDPVVQGLLRDLLTDAGYRIKMVGNAFQARGALARFHPDLVILDRGLPDAEGVDFIKEIRAQPQCAALPVLFLTAKGTPTDKVEGLRSGGDDYLSKPFSNQELLARVEALLRRSRRPPEPVHVLRGKGILVDLDRHVVELAGKPVELSPKEFELLATLLEKHGRILSRQFLLQRVWGEGMDLRMNVKTVDVAVGRLREALGSWGKHIVAVQGYGYRFDAEG